MSDGKMEGDTYNIPDRISLINIKFRKDQITLDLRTRQVRYLKNIANRGEILFMPLSNSDADCYEYLFKVDQPLFLRTLKEDLQEFLGVKINPKNCEVMK